MKSNKKIKITESQYKRLVSEQADEKGSINYNMFIDDYGTLNLSYRKIMAMVVGIMFYLHLQSKGE